MKVNLYKQNGKETKEAVELSDVVFAAPVNENLLAQYVFIYLSNQREAIAHAKERGEVSGGGKKPWKQKGTGKARAGSNRSPLWKGGGVTFGPRSERNWKKALNKKMKAGAIRSAFSKLVKEGNLKLVDTITLQDEKLTKQAVEIMAAFKAKKLTIIAPAQNDNLMRAFANLSGARVIQVGELNAYDLLNGGEVLLLNEAVEFTKVWDK